MDKHALDLLVSIGKCHRLLQEYVAKLSSYSGVSSIKHSIDMPVTGEVFRLEEYIDAELKDGEVISWCLEITLTTDVIAIEADVRRIHADGQDLIASIAECEFRSSEVASHTILEITQKLCETHQHLI